MTTAANIRFITISDIGYSTVVNDHTSSAATPSNNFTDDNVKFDNVSVCGATHVFRTVGANAAASTTVINTTAVNGLDVNAHPVSATTTPTNAYQSLR